MDNDIFDSGIQQAKDELKIRVSRVAEITKQIKNKHCYSGHGNRYKVEMVLFSIIAITLIIFSSTLIGTLFTTNSYNNSQTIETLGILTICSGVVYCALCVVRAAIQLTYTSKIKELKNGIKEVEDVLSSKLDTLNDSILVLKEKIQYGNIDIKPSMNFDAEIAHYEKMANNYVLKPKGHNLLDGFARVMLLIFIALILLTFITNY